MANRILFLFNAKSGPSNSGVPPLAVQRHLEKARDTARLLKVEKGIEKLLKDTIEDFQPTHLIAIGGDGTVKLAAESILDKDILLGIIPTGSANGLASELEISTDPDKALADVLHGEVSALDMAELNGQYSIHLADLGFNASLVRGFQRSNIRGFLGYAKEFISHWPDQEVFDVVVEQDHERVERKNIIMVVVANAESYGTGAVINPGGKVDDGYIEICLVKNLRLVNLVEMMFDNIELDKDFIVQVRVKEKAKIKLSKKVPFQIDGEYIGKRDEIEMTVRSQAIKLVS
jgi:YegS/Rv2252/BmrU family lipid kinase